MEHAFKINYDDEADTVLSKVSQSLVAFGLRIIEKIEGDGWIEYSIVKIETNTLA